MKKSTTIAPALAGTKSTPAVAPPEKAAALPAPPAPTSEALETGSAPAVGSPISPAGPVSPPSTESTSNPATAESPTASQSPKRPPQPQPDAESKQWLDKSAVSDEPRTSISSDEPVAGAYTPTTTGALPAPAQEPPATTDPALSLAHVVAARDSSRAVAPEPVLLGKSEGHGADSKQPERHIADPNQPQKPPPTEQPQPQEEADALHSPPDPDIPTGILSVVIHQINNRASISPVRLVVF